MTTKEAPTLTGPEAIHNDALAAALTAIDVLVQQEIGEGEYDEDDLTPLITARVALTTWAEQEAGEYTDDDAGSLVTQASWKSADRDRLIHKSIPAGTPIATEPTGRIRAIVNTTNVVDKQGDNIRPGAWQKVIQGGKYPKLLVSHKWDALPVGKVTALDEWMPRDVRLSQWHLKNGAGALVMDAQVNMATEAGRDFFSAVSGGYLDEYSVGFLTAPDGEHRDSKGFRNVTDVELFPEISGVLVGASPMTLTLATKSAATAELSEDVEDLIESIVAEEVTNASFRDAELSPELKLVIKELVAHELSVLEQPASVGVASHASRIHGTPNPRGAAIPQR